MSAPFDQFFFWLKDHHFNELECVVSDLTGIARDKIAPTANFLNERGMRLPESALPQIVTGDIDDDVYYSLLDPAYTDMICNSDSSAVCQIPWSIEPTATVIYDTFDKQANPVALRYAIC